ncbi:phosphate uptake regulator PhoU [Halarchaeum sp. CBA1220]|uniref:AbrB/MazE/SpoVT family DNA-binding domain-containing protein n=1 Tax=Halarchaeum sp. CBA1220 TaxID=1853682 RepID=UPI000F3AA6B9|nr:AbrB/MazE/SpoVT family DNA-binding domain-containing protein [Halarchaeum sp. CBA1220]QLC33794.1 phosphate uptake regulator PhoU [Halarchaeum sp. CBA1220]
METRKLQKVGGGTYTVSIPKEWATDHHLEAGAPVHVYTHDDGTLVVRSSRRDEEPIESVTLDVSADDPGDVERVLHAAYTAGFTDVTLTTTEAFADDHHRAARSVASTLAGAELLDATEQEIAMRNFLDSGEVSMRQAVGQLRFLTLAIHRTATTDIGAGVGERREGLHQREGDVDRFFGLVTHHFTRALASLKEVDALGVSRLDLFAYYLTARQLTSVVSHVRSVIAELERVEHPVPEAFADEVDALAEAARDVIERATTAVLNDATLADASDILDDAENVAARAADARHAVHDGETGARADVRALAGLLDGVERTAECGAEIAEIAVHTAIRAEHEP